MKGVRHQDDLFNAGVMVMTPSPRKLKVRMAANTFIKPKCNILFSMYLNQTRDRPISLTLSVDEKHLGQPERNLAARYRICRRPAAPHQRRVQGGVDPYARKVQLSPCLLFETRSGLPVPIGREGDAADATHQ